MASEEKLSAKVSTAASDIGSFIRDLRESAQVSVRQLAERSGVSNPYLSQVERGLRKPSAEVLNQIAKALRVSAEVLYVQAGMLEPSDKSQVRDAVITDTAITERQKQVLLDVYASFIQQNEFSREVSREEYSTESDCQSATDARNPPETRPGVPRTEPTCRLPDQMPNAKDENNP